MPRATSCKSSSSTTARPTARGGRFARLAADDPRILGIRFRRNFGKAAALSAGFHAADGERIVTIDGDLQDDPAEIARLLAKLDEGFDVVSGWKRERHDPWHKVLPSRVFNWLVSHLTGVHLHDHNCGLKAFRREVMHEIRLYGELHRFVPVLAAAKGFRTGEVVVQHRPRKFGRSKYGLSRLSKGLLDLADGEVPDRLRPAAAAFAGHGRADRVPARRLGHGVSGRAWVRLAHERRRAGRRSSASRRRRSYYSLALFIIGAQFLSIGLLGEMIAAYLVRDTDTYSIAEHTPPAQYAARHALRRDQRRAMTDAPRGSVCPPPLGRLLRADRGRRRQHDGPAAGRQLGRQSAARGVPHQRATRSRASARAGRGRPCGRASSANDWPTLKRGLRNELRLQRPFLSANDRSRWMTIRSLVEHGTYEIDEIVGQPTWDTIDMVQHRGRDGELHLYSSKPPLSGHAAGRRVLADPPAHRRDACRSSVRNRPRRCCSRSTFCRWC